MKKDGTPTSAVWPVVPRSGCLEFARHATAATLIAIAFMLSWSDEAFATGSTLIAERIWGVPFWCNDTTLIYGLSPSEVASRSLSDGKTAPVVTGEKPVVPFHCSNGHLLYWDSAAGKDITGQIQDSDLQGKTTFLASRTRRALPSPDWKRLIIQGMPTPRQELKLTEEQRQQLAATDSNEVPQMVILDLLEIVGNRAFDLMTETADSHFLLGTMNSIYQKYAEGEGSVTWLTNDLFAVTLLEPPAFEGSIYIVSIEQQHGGFVDKGQVIDRVEAHYAIPVSGSRFYAAPKRGLLERMQQCEMTPAAVTCRPLDILSMLDDLTVAAWSPERLNIAFADGGSRLVITVVEKNRPCISEIDLNTGGYKCLVDDVDRQVGSTKRVTWLALSPDGNWIAFAVTASAANSLFDSPAQLYVKRLH